MRFSKQTILPLSVQLLVLIAIYKNDFSSYNTEKTQYLKITGNQRRLRAQIPLSALILQEEAQKNKTAHMNCPDTTVPLGNPVFNRLVLEC